MLTTSQSKVETSICTPFLSISHFCTTFRSPAAQESTGRNQPNRCVLHKARVRWRHRRLRHLCHRKKHSTRQKDKSIEKGITTIWNIYIYHFISDFPYCYIALCCQQVFTLSGLSSGLPIAPTVRNQVAMPYGPGLGTWRASWDQDGTPGLGDENAWSPMLCHVGFDCQNRSQGHQVHQLDVAVLAKICFLQVLLTWAFHLKDKIWVDLRVHRFLDKTVLATSYPSFGSMGQIPLHSAPRLRNALKQEAIGVVRSEVTSEKTGDIFKINRIMWEKQCHKPAMTGNGLYPYTSYLWF